VKTNPRVIIHLDEETLGTEMVAEQIVKTLKLYRHYEFQTVVVLTQEDFGVLTPFIEKITRPLLRQGVPLLTVSGAEASSVKVVSSQIQQVRGELFSAILDTETNPVLIVSSQGLNEDNLVVSVGSISLTLYLAKALKADQMIYWGKEEGLFDKDSHWIEVMNFSQLENWIGEQEGHGSSVYKAVAALQALKSGIPKVRLIQAEQAMDGLWSDQVGTNLSLGHQEMTESLEDKEVCYVHN